MVLLINAVFMLLAAAVSLAAGGGAALVPLLVSAGIVGTLGGVPAFRFPSEKHVSAKEGYCIVVGAWLASCVVGMLPYLLWGGPFGLGNAWFESVSGFTTTGASIVPNVELLPKGLLFWRSCTHFIGGVGVVMFAMLVMPILGRSRLMVASMEMSASARDDYKYTSGKIVRILLGVYLGLTAACFVSYMMAGMGWFDAVNHAMSTISTGGFSTKNESIAFWNSPAVELVAMFFMVLSGIHFGVIFATLTGRRNNMFRSEVVRYYLACILGVTLVITGSVVLQGVYPTVWEALRYAAFETVAFATTTGFVATDATFWGPLAMALLLAMGIQCACAGSTSGGLKADRVYLAAKVIRLQIRQQQHPNAIIRIKLGGVLQESSTLGFVMLFIVTYVLLLGFGAAVISAWGYDLTTSMSMSMMYLGNVGQGFGHAGGFCCFETFPGGVKWFCTLLMLLGRLEIFGFIQLFLLRWWK